MTTLIADSGSTKTDWALVDDAGQILFTGKTQGINPFHLSDDDIWKILRKEGKTALLVTHDISEAISMSDRVIILSKAPACVRCEIPVFTVLTDRTPMQMRNAPEFKQYFQQIWKELNHDT